MRSFPVRKVKQPINFVDYLEDHLQGRGLIETVYGANPHPFSKRHCIKDLCLAVVERTNEF